MRQLIMAFGIVFLVVPLASGTTYLVKPDGTGDFPTIQAAIDAAAPSDSIVLASGTYAGNGNRDIDFLGKAIVVRSASIDPDSCTIDCEGTEADPHRGISFISGESYDSVLEGITIRNGDVTGMQSPYNAGGGILCGEQAISTPTLYKCRIENCRASGGAGGIGGAYGAPYIDSCVICGNYCVGSTGGVCFRGNDDLSVTIVNSVFRNNSGREGGGVLLSDVLEANIHGCTFAGNIERYHYGGGIRIYGCGELHMSECVFIGNAAELRGGGMSINDCVGIVENCTFYENYANGGGGAISLSDGDGLFIERCTIHGNFAETGGSMYAYGFGSPVISNTIITSSLWGGGFRYQLEITPQLFCCNIHGNVGGDWIGPLAQQYGMQGNICVDPCYCDPIANDFHLWNYSPCNQQGYCEGIGAWPVGCTEPQHAAEEPTAWGDGHSLFLAQNTPNPFASTTRVAYTVPGNSPTKVRLTIYDTGGRLIRTLVDGDGAPGANVASWDGTNDAGSRVAAGAYFYRLTVHGESATRQMLMVR